MLLNSLLATVTVVATTTLVAALPQQIPFNASPASTPSHPFLTQNTQNDFEVLTHKSFPGHSVRARTPKGLCDPTVEQKSGYLDTDNGRHFYFWMFESRNDPKNDPIVMWLNGGPGCSSFTGLLMELGPCRVQPIGQDPKVNPYSWNSNASLIFLDQPIGVGYSYGAKNDKGVWSTEAAAVDVYAFLQIFFETFKEKFGNTPFHIAGESYAGRYIPLFADYIVEQNIKNQALIDGGRQQDAIAKINLASVLIGNGFTNPKTQYGYYYPTVCTNVTGYGPYVSEEDCAMMKRTLPRCQELVQKCYDNPADAAVCLAANTYCERTQTEKYYETGRNPYDMQKFGPYAEEKQVAHFLNRADVRHELGVDMEEDGGVKKFIGCSDEVGFRFGATGDQSKASYPKVAHMIDNGVAALLYAGKADFICNYLGNEAWTLALNWTGQADFNHQDLKPWYASAETSEKGKQAGVYRQSGNLAFAVVDDSGHFVPYDHPVESLAMFNGWIHHTNFSVGFSN